MIIKTTKSHREHGAKITATGSIDNESYRVTLPYDHALSYENNHIEAAKELAYRQGVLCIPVEQSRHDRGFVFTAGE